MEKTNISEMIDATDGKIRYDTKVKKVLANKRILAWILKCAVKEFYGMELEQIMECIEGDPEVSCVPVYPGKTNMEQIVGMANEDHVPNEGDVTFDIRFYAIVPGDQKVKVIINLEAQNEYYPGYDLVTRAVFYCARMLSAQLDTEFTVKANDPVKYDNIKKVYSIWVCMDSPKMAENTITEYSMEPKNIYGNFAGKARHDLLSVVMICLGKDDTGCENGLLNMLSTLLSPDLDKEDKKQTLENDFDIPMTVEFEQEVSEMCNLSDYVEMRGIEKGKTEGRVEGKIQVFINMVNRGFSVADAQSIAELSDEQVQQVLSSTKK